MNTSGNLPTHSGHPQEPQAQQRNTNTGEGSGTALAAMLKKRREGENHPEDAVQGNADDGPAAQ